MEPDLASFFDQLKRQAYAEFHKAELRLKKARVRRQHARNRLKYILWREKQAQDGKVSGDLLAMLVRMNGDKSD